MLETRSLSVSVGGNTILSDISCVFETGKTYFVVGKNGSGKSSFALALMGHPRYSVDSGDMLLDAVSIRDRSVTERSHAGIFLALQNVPEIPGVRLGEYLRTVYNAHLARLNATTKPLSPFVFRRFIKPFLAEFSLPESFLDRDLNVAFSGGEKRRIEMVQATLLRPRVVIVDEIDSWLDVDAFTDVGNALGRIAASGTTLVVVTHNYRLAEYVRPDAVILFESGRIKSQGNADMLESIARNGF